MGQASRTSLDGGIDPILWKRIYSLEPKSHPDTGDIPDEFDVKKAVILLNELCIAILKTFVLYLERENRESLGPIETLDVLRHLLNYVDDVRPYFKILNSVIRFHQNRKLPKP